MSERKKGIRSKNRLQPTFGQKALVIGTSASELNLLVTAGAEVLSHKGFQNEAIIKYLTQHGSCS